MIQFLLHQKNTVNRPILSPILEENIGFNKYPAKEKNSKALIRKNLVLYTRVIIININKLMIS